MSDFFGPAFEPGLNFVGVLTQLDLQGIDISNAPTLQKLVLGPTFEPGLDYQGILRKLDAQGVDVSGIPTYQGNSTPIQENLLAGVSRNNIVPKLSDLLSNNNADYISAERLYDSPLDIQKIRVAPNSVVNALMSQTDILATTDRYFNFDFAREAANEINVTVTGFLDDVGFERTVDVNEIISNVGYTATHQNIFSTALGGQIGARSAAEALLPSGIVFNAAIDSITTDTVDLSQTTLALLPYSDLQISTEEVLYSLGLNLTYGGGGNDSGFTFFSRPETRQVDLISSLESVVDIDLNIGSTVGDQNAEADINFSRIASLSTNKPTLDGLLNGLRDANGNLPSVATRADILRAGAPGQVSVEEIFSGVLDPGNSVSEGEIIGMAGNAKVDISQYGISLLQNKYERVNILEAAKELGIQDGESYKYSDFNRALTDQPITQLGFLRNLQTELNVNFDLDNNIDNDFVHKTVSLSDVASLSENMPTLEGLLNGLRDDDGNLPEVATRAEIMNVAVNGQVSLSRLLSGVLPRNNGVGENAIVDRVGDILVNVGNAVSAQLENPDERVSIIAAAEELGIPTKGLFGRTYLNNITLTTLDNIEAEVGKISSLYELIGVDDNSTYQSISGASGVLTIVAESATVYDGDAPYSRINIERPLNTVHVNTGGISNKHLSIPDDSLLSPGSNRLNFTEVNLSPFASGTNIVIQAQDPITEGGGHYYQAGEVAKINFSDVSQIGSVLIEADPSQIFIQKLNPTTYSVQYEQDSNFRVSTGTNASINGGASGGGANLGISIGQSTEVTTTKPGVQYIPIAIFEGVDLSNVLYGEDSIFQFDTNIPL